MSSHTRIFFFFFFQLHRCTVEINETGTVLRYTPGTIVCGRGITHDCGTSRSLGWFLEGICLLAPFGKKQLGLTLLGITNDTKDPSVDVFRSITVPLLKQFGVDAGVEVKIVKRGCAPGGGGEVVFNCPNIRALTPTVLMDVGMVKKIRGVAYSCRVSQQLASRIVEAAKALPLSYIPDVFIFVDHFKGADAGESPGFGVSMVAETTTGARVSSEATALEGVMADPEGLGVEASRRLMEEIAAGGCVDSSHQSMAACLMALGPEDVSKVRVGRLTEHAISTLRHIRDFTGVTFKISPERDGSILLTCLGTGYINLAKKIQ